VPRRAPRLADYGVASGWAGLYEVTPDHNASLAWAVIELATAAGVGRKVEL